MVLNRELLPVCLVEVAHATISSEQPMDDCGAGNPPGRAPPGSLHAAPLYFSLQGMLTHSAALRPVAGHAVCSGRLEKNVAANRAVAHDPGAWERPPRWPEFGIHLFARF